MKMTLRQVIQRSLDMEKISTLILPIRMSYAITYNAERLAEEAHRVEHKRVELCEQYADKDNEGRPVIVENTTPGGEHMTEYRMTPESRAAFAREYADLLSGTVDVDIRTVRRDVLDKCEESERYSIPSAAQLAVMEFMLTDD